MNLQTVRLNNGVIAFRADDKKADKKPAQDKKVTPKVDTPKQETELLDDFIKDTTTPLSGIDDLKRRGKTVKKFVGNSINKWQNFLKFKARASEYIKGAFNGVVAGLGIGGAIMSMDWAMKGIARIAKKEASPSMFIKEPAKLVTRAFGRVFKAIYNLPDLTLRQLTKDVIHSPIDLFRYVKDAPNVSRIGKTVAPLVGGGVMAYCLGKAVLRANQRVANIEHAFNSGHAHDLK